MFRRWIARPKEPTCFEPECHKPIESHELCSRCWRAFCPDHQQQHTCHSAAPESDAGDQEVIDWSRY